MHFLTKTFAALPFFIMLVVPAEAVAQYTVDKERLLSAIEYLSSDEMAGRRTATPQNEQARLFIEKAFKEAGLTSFGGSFMHPFEFKNRQGVSIKGTNVVGFLAGKSDSLIILTAHFDHLGVRGEDIYNGSDDNASGTAALMEMATILSKTELNHTIVFAALDAEEMGLQGARALFGSPVFDTSTIRMNINMDMISINDRNELYASGTYHHPGLKPLLEEVERGTVNLRFGHDRPEQGSDDWTGQSDHGVFHQNGIPFIYFGVEDHPHYHRPTDIFENIHKDFLCRCGSIYSERPITYR